MNRYLGAPTGGWVKRGPPTGDCSLDELSPYDRATLGMWQRSHHQLTQEAEHRQLLEAGMHAILSGLRAWTQPSQLFAAYEEGTAADLILVRDLLPPDASEEVLWRVREAAFYLRYLEITSSSE